MTLIFCTGLSKSGRDPIMNSSASPGTRTRQSPSCCTSRVMCPRCASRPGGVISLDISQIALFCASVVKLWFFFAKAGGSGCFEIVQKDKPGACLVLCHFESRLLQLTPARSASVIYPLQNAAACSYTVPLLCFLQWLQSTLTCTCSLSILCMAWLVPPSLRLQWRHASRFFYVVWPRWWNRRLFALRTAEDQPPYQARVFFVYSSHQKGFGLDGSPIPGEPALGYV